MPPYSPMGGATSEASTLLRYLGSEVTCNMLNSSITGVRPNAIPLVGLALLSVIGLLNDICPNR